MKILLNILILTFFLSPSAYSTILDGVKASNEIEYTIRLKNGDILTGYITEFVSSSNLDEGDGIKLRTSIGKATIYESQIAEICINGEDSRSQHRIYMLPTAEGIGNNHYIGLFEMLFLYTGVGITDWVSITAGTTLLPGTRWDEQIKICNLKLTVYNQKPYPLGDGFSFAVGGNLAFVNNNNRIVNIYGAGTYQGEKTTLTASVFYKTGGESFYVLNFGENSINMVYEEGAIGIGIGIETKFSTWKNFHFIGELWNNNVAKPTRSGVLLGFRLGNTLVSADFGLAFFTQPLIVPFTSFVFTPF